MQHGSLEQVEHAIECMQHDLRHLDEGEALLETSSERCQARRVHQPKAFLLPHKEKMGDVAFSTLTQTRKRKHKQHQLP